MKPHLGHVFSQEYQATALYARHKFSLETLTCINEQRLALLLSC